MTPGRWAAALAILGAIVAAVLPVPEAIEAGTTLRARLVSAVLTVTVTAGLALARIGRRQIWFGLAAVAAGGGGALLLGHAGATTACVATYDGRSVLIGRDLTPAAREYVTKHPGASASDLLLDAGGLADRLWTPASIASCGFWTGWAGLLSLPCFAAAVGALASSRGVRLGSAPMPVRPEASTVSRPPVYDAFLSYRHTEPDKTRADEILEALESRGLRVAIDVRDFVPNEHFLSEMERCITESRFVLCVVSPRYVDSDHCVEEAIISKTLDMSERTRRLVPLIFEPVDLPVWLHGLVGIDFTEAARVDPVDRLVDLLQRERLKPGAPGRPSR
jgi:TIR domain